MFFDVTGPFEVSRSGKKKLITGDSVAGLKNELEKRKPGLSDARGCYVFALRTPKGYTPYYVGQSCQLSILKEALNHSNITKYNQACQDSKGTPVIFFLPMLTPKGKFRKRGKSTSSTDFLERWLIAAALSKNRGLLNNKETKFLRRIHVIGTLNPKKGEATRASAELRKSLGIL